MSGPSYTGRVSALEVTVQIDGAHPKLTEYPLLPGDLLFEREDGAFGKFGPGLGIEGFRLTDEQRASLRAVEGLVEWTGSSGAVREHRS